MNTSRSQLLFDAARRLAPGGVHSPVRAFTAVGGTPLFIERGRGAELVDVDGNRFVDYVLSWGPLVLGHAAPAVVQAVTEAASRGTCFGAPHAAETELAAMIVEALPSVEMVRFVNSGTEATMSALRLARAYTGRDRILKFAGCYHGHVDALLARAGSGVATLGLPDSPGVPEAAAAQTVVVPFNDLGAVQRKFEELEGEVAAVIVEPVAGNMGVIPPESGFLEGLRAVTQERGALLVFDEVMTGFRVHPRGAQGRYQVMPDLTTLGKVIGGGLPVGAYGGRRDIMELVAPSGHVYQAGTLSGNPLAMAAGLATLKELGRPGRWEQLERIGRRAADAIAVAATRARVPIVQHRVGSMFSTFFADAPVRDWDSAAQSDTGRFRRFFWTMLENGVYLPPSPFETCFVSLAHDDPAIEATGRAAERAFATLGTA